MSTVDRILDVPSAAIANWVDAKSDAAIALWMAVTLFLFFFVANIPVSGPVYSADEGGYLANAAAIAGFRVEAANRYHAGYPLLLAPLFGLFSDPRVLYGGVKAVNCALWAMTAGLLFLLSRQLFQQKSRAFLLAAIFLATLYPAWLAGAGYAMSGAAFAFLFVLCGFGFLQIERRGGVYWLLGAVPLGFLYWIHPTALAVVGSASIVGLYLAVQKRAWLGYLAFLVVTCALLLVYQKLFTPWLSELMTPSARGTEDVRYVSFLAELYKLLNPETFAEFLVKTAGHLAYIGMASFGLALVPVFYLVVGTLSWRAELLSARHFPVLLFFCLSFLAVLLMSAMFFSIFNVYRLDHWMYGRYVEGTAIVMIGIGAILWNERFHGMILLLVAVCLACLYFGLSDTAERYVNVNGLGLWQPLVSSFRFAGEAPSAAVLRWGSSGLFLMAGLFLLRDIRLKYLAVIVIFLFTSALQLLQHFGMTRLYSEPKYELAAAARELYPELRCVNMEVGAWRAKSSWLAYAFYFHNSEFTRYTLKDWPGNCPGPLLSAGLEVDGTISGAMPIAFNKYDGLILWASPSEAGNVSADSRECPLLSCMRLEGVGAGETQVGRRDTRGISSTGRSGYLLHRQFVPMKRGVYGLQLQGQLTGHGRGTLVSVVSSQNGEVIAEFEELVQQPAPGGLLLDTRFILEQDVSALELKIRVAASTDILLEDYIIKRIDQVSTTGSG